MLAIWLVKCYGYGRCVVRVSIRYGVGKVSAMTLIRVMV